MSARDSTGASNGRPDMARTTTSYRATRATPYPIEVLAVPWRRVRRRNWSSLGFLGRSFTAIVNGSDHPCWRTPDAWAQLAVLPSREQNRLLDSGRVTTKL